MIITYLGLEAFKIQFGDTTIALNPISKDSKQKSSRFGADIALVSLNDKDFNGVDNVARGDKQPFVINGPGEYEIKGIFIKGFKTESFYGGAKEPRINTVYTIALEGMNLCFLGAFDSKDLPTDTNEAIEDIDVLFMPVGGEGNFSAATAYDLAVKLEPKLIIPMNYSGADDKNLKLFLKEAGEEKIQPEEKLTLKRKDLDGKEAAVVVLVPSL